MEFSNITIKKLAKSTIANSLVRLFNLPYEDDWRAFECTDPMYLPFYYYLGQTLNPKIILELGFGIGLCSGSFLKSCQSVNDFIAFQEQTKEYYPHNISRHNIKRVYKKNFYFHYGNLNDEKFSELIEKFKPEFILIRDKSQDRMSQYLDFAWNTLNYDGIMCVDYVDISDENKSLFDTFCKVRNRDAFRLKTRYGIGIIVK